jgi:hypothetical protein
MSEANQAATETKATETATAASDNPHVGPAAEAPGKIADLVIELGAGWARYGLSLGRMALAQSAKTLVTTSELLGAVADKLGKHADANKPGA